MKIRITSDIRANVNTEPVPEESMTLKDRIYLGVLLSKQGCDDKGEINKFSPQNSNLEDYVPCEEMYNEIIEHLLGRGIIMVSEVSKNVISFPGVSTSNWSNHIHSLVSYQLNVNYNKSLDDFINSLNSPDNREPSSNDAFVILHPIVTFRVLKYFKTRLSLDNIPYTVTSDDIEKIRDLCLYSDLNDVIFSIYISTNDAIIRLWRQELPLQTAKSTILATAEEKLYTSAFKLKYSLKKYITPLSYIERLVLGEYLDLLDDYIHLNISDFNHD